MKRIIVFVIAFALCLAMVACSAPAAPSPSPSASSVEPSASSPSPSVESSKPAGTVDIGIVLPTKDEPRWLQDEARFKDLISSTNYKVEVLFSQKDSSVEKNNVDALVSKGIKVLIICPQDAAAAAAAATGKDLSSASGTRPAGGNSPPARPPWFR